MLERYLLSTLASKFGHLFEDFDEHTKAELSAWRGVLALRNLHLRRDALRHLGVPLAACEGDTSEDEIDDEPGAPCCAPDTSCAPIINTHDGGEASDDDSFLSCASQIDGDDDDGFQPSDHLDGEQGDDSSRERPAPPKNKSNAPTIEVVHGSIGSLELHIPWKLLRATRLASENGEAGQKAREESRLGEVDDSLRCSAVLSDVRILLAPSNHSRSRAKFRKGSTDHKPNRSKEGDTNEPPEIQTKIQLNEVGRMRKEREVQSLLERELFRLVRGVESDGDEKDVNKPTDKEPANSNAAAQESWLVLWAKKLVARFLSSLQVTVQNIHVRYEDEGYGWFEEEAPSESHKRCQCRPAFAVGMRLGNFSVRNAHADEEMPAGLLDEENAPIPETAQLRRKVANVEKLSVYWDSSHPDLFVGYKTEEDDREYYEKRFEELHIMSSDDFDGGTLQHSYLIEPVSPSLQLVVFDPEGAIADATTSELELLGKDTNPELHTQKNATAKPLIHASLCLPSCHINFDRNTLEDVAYVRKCLSAYKDRIVSSRESVIEQRISRQLLDLRPPSGTRPGDDPRRWWKYAIGAVRSLQSDRSYFEGNSDTKGRKPRKTGWLGLARLLRLRNEYTALYDSLWSSMQIDVESKSKVHSQLVALEDLLNVEEIAAFRLAAFMKLSKYRKLTFCERNSDSPSFEDEGIRSPDSLDVDELLENQNQSLSVLSLEYRETKLNQIVRSIDSEQNEFDVTVGQSPANVESAVASGQEDASPVRVVSIVCQDFAVQANDTPSTNDALNIISTASKRGEVVPIATLQCLSSLRFEKFLNGAWDLACGLSSLTVSDLISPRIEKSPRGRTLIGRKQPNSLCGEENTNTEDDHTASIVIRNVISGDSNIRNQATAHFEATVSPLEVIYSTNAFEALSRLFAAVQTNEFSRDYERVTRALSSWRSRQGKRLMTVLARRRKNLIVSICVAAPVLFIPEELQHAASPMLVIDLGRLTFRSDSSEPPPLGFDDKWQLQIDSIQALCINSITSREHAIIEPFSIKFSISTHIAEGETSGTPADTTKIAIQALLPQLCFNLTSSAVRLVSRLQMRWSDAKLRNPRISPRQKLDEFLLTNRGLSRRHSILNEFSSPQLDAPNEVAVTKQELSFLFSAPTIALQIGDDIGPKLISLIYLSIRGIHGNFLSCITKAGTSTQFSARLRSIHAADIQKAGSPFCNFLSSIDPDSLEDFDTTRDSNDGDDDLVAVEMSTQPNGDQETSIHFHELYVEWNPELLATIQKSLRLPPTQCTMTAASSTGIDLNITNQLSNESEFFDALDDTVTKDDNNRAINNQTPSVTKPFPHFKIMFHLSKLRVNFNKDSQFRCLFTAEMNQTNISFCRKTSGGAITTATVANVRLRDPDGSTGGSLYGQLIGSSSSVQTSSIVNMSFESFTNCDEPEYHNLMKIEFSEMVFVYLHQLWLEVFDYVFEGILGNAVSGTAPKPSAYIFDPSKAMRSFKRTKFSIEMVQPLLLLPLCYRSPQHIRLKMNALKITNHFVKELMTDKEGSFTEWAQWFNNAKVEFCGLDVQSWDERRLNEVSKDKGPPSMTINVRWPVGPTAPLIKPKWNVDARVDPIVFCLSRKDFSLFRFFVSYNLLEESRFISKQSPPDDTKRLVLFGYEKTGAPPTTYSLKLSSDSLEFQFKLDEDESESGKIEEMMTVYCSNASWSMLKHVDYISKQRVKVESIRLASNKHEWRGFPDLLLPLPSSNASMIHSHCLLHFTSTTHPNGNNMKTLKLDAAGIYLIAPAWRHVGDFFIYLPTSPEVFAPEEMCSIMQVGFRFYRMSKSSSRAMNSLDGMMPEVKYSAPSPQVSKQFLLTLTSPQIIMVADATNRQNDSPRVTLSMSHLHFLRQSKYIDDEEHLAHSVFCDGLEIFTGMTNDLSPPSSLLCPLAVSGSLTRIMQSKSSPQKSAWVWVDEVEARATYTDLVHAIKVFNGVNEQMSSATLKNQRTASQPVVQARPMNENKSSNAKDEKGVAAEKKVAFRLSVDILCDRMGLVVTDDSQRQFANAQPLVSLSLTGLRCSRLVTYTDPPEQNHPTQSPQCVGLTENAFVSLDSLDLTDLLQPGSSPFRLLATSSHKEHSSKRGLFSFTAQIELSSMSWQSHQMVLDSEWGFQMSPSMKQRHRAIQQLTPPSRYFDKSAGRHEHLMAFRSVLHENGLKCIDFGVQHLTAQWNPSTIVAVQRFLGRLKKAAVSILFKTSANKISSSNLGLAQAPLKKPAESGNIIFSVNADVGSVCICLNKEYQQRRLLDVLVKGVQIQFECYKDESLLLHGSIQNFRAWDPDLSRTTSDRNRTLLGLTKGVNENIQSDGFFLFQYRTFRTPLKDNRHSCLPGWVDKKISSGEDIDDFLMVKMKPLEFNHISERTAELADYLKHGLPGKGLGRTSKAAQSFCERRIRTRSFLDLVIDQPRVFIPRSHSSFIGGCYLALGTVAVTSWFEEGFARVTGHSSRDIDNHRLVGNDSLSLSSKGDGSLDEMDWWRVLNVVLGIGVQVEVNQPNVEGLSNPDTFFHSNFTVWKPSSGTTTIIQGTVPSLNILLKYREFMMLNLVALENIGKSINTEHWENIEKSYWENNDTSLAADSSNDQGDKHSSSVNNTSTSLMYAESARFVRFGEAKAALSNGNSIRFQFEAGSINVRLHRDDWYENLDEESAALLCYDICKFSIQKMDVSIEKRQNGNKTTSIALHGISFTDVGDYGRLARDLYLGSHDSKRPPCAFSVVAEGYGESSEDPLVSVVMSTQYSKLKSEGDDDASQDKKIRNIELKVNSLSLTVLPRSIDDVVCFFLKKWNCPNSNLEIKGALSSPSSSKNYAEEDASTTDTLQFKFVAVYPRLILLADEYNPFSRALVLRGLAVGDMSVVRNEASSVSRYGQVDAMTTTTLSGHIKELETYVHNNIDMMIGPNRTGSENNASGVTLIEPVTVSVKVKIESRSRFPSTRFVSIEVEPVSMSLSFGDLNLIETVIKKSTKRKERIQSKPEMESQLSPLATQVDSLQFSKSSDYSECDEGSERIEVVMLTKRLGLQLRMSGSSVIVESSLTNPNIEPGDTLVSINGKPIERMPLRSIVDIFENTPRPLTITVSRFRQPSSLVEASRNQPLAANYNNAPDSNSTSFDMNFSQFASPSSDNTGISEEERGGSISNQNRVGKSRRFDITLVCGKPSGLELKAGMGDSAVVNKVDFKAFASAVALDQDKTSNQFPLPGAILLAVDGEIDGSISTFEKLLHQLGSYEACDSHKSYCLSFVIADSSSWGNVTNFEGKLNFRLTIIDDTNGRDMPVLRVGMKETSFNVNHGLAVATKTIHARRPILLSYDPQNEGSDSSTVFALELNVSSFDLEFNNAMINVWEPIIEPHCLLASIERQSGSGSQPGQCSIEIYDNNSRSSSDPNDFICVNVSDSALMILSKAAVGLRLSKNPKSQTSGENENPESLPETPRTSQSVFGNNQWQRHTSTAADLKRATKLAKLALDFSRKGGKITHTDTSNSPFVFRNRSGLVVSISTQGTETTAIRDGQDEQFRINPVSENDLSQRNGTRFRKYDGHQFPTVDIKLGFDILGTRSGMSNQGCRHVYADRITDLPTDKVGRTMRSVCLWKKELDELISQRINVVWAVELEENRRVLTLSSATSVKVFGCGSAIEVGVRFSSQGSSDEIDMIGSTLANNIFHLPVWVESCFSEIDVFVRPSAQTKNERGENVYKWSTFPVLSLKEVEWNADASEVHYDWVTKTLGGVPCQLSAKEEQNECNPVWMCCTYSKDFSKNNRLGDKHAGPDTSTQVTIWSAVTIRNMLPRNIEWEVASHVNQDGTTSSIIDSSFKRNKQHHLHGRSSSSSEHTSLQCGSAVEVFAADSLDTELHARFKCILRNECCWSEWLNIGQTSRENAMGETQVNIQCKIDSFESPLNIGVKLSSRVPEGGRGINLILYAEIWLRNFTSLPLTFGAPSLQLGRDVESSLPGKISADSALIELSSVLEGSSFGLFSNADIDDDDIDGDDILNLPLQQCEEVFEEVFEYLSLNEKGEVQRKWWASENHVKCRQEPIDNVAKQDDTGPWLVDCAGEPFLQRGWESCTNIAGSKSFNFNGRRLFDRRHRFRRRRWFRKTKTKKQRDGSTISDRVIFHQPADLDQSTRSKREAERNALGVHIDEKKNGSRNVLDDIAGSAGMLDIISRVANDGSILIYVKHKDGKFSSPAIIPASGSANGVIRACSSRWPIVTKAIKEQKQKAAPATWDNSDGCDPDNVGIAPLEPTVFEFVYQVTPLSGLWGELSRMVTIVPRFLIRNESSWLDIDLKQVGAPDTSRVQVKKGERGIPFYWFDLTLPELVCARPTQSRNRFKWSGGFDMCTLGMIPLRVRRTDGSIDQLNIRSIRVNVELQPGTGGSGITVSLRDEDPQGEGSLFKIENHSPFQVFVSQDGVLANPLSMLIRNEASLSCDMIQPGERTSYALDVPWRQGKYAGRTSASMSELLLLRCALAPLSTRDGVESTKVVCFGRVGDSIRLSPSRLSSVGSNAASELLGVRVLGLIGTDGPTRTLRFILMQKDVTPTGYIGNAMRDTISPMPSFISVESSPDYGDEESRTKAALEAAQTTTHLLNKGALPDETEAAKQAYFGIGICRRPLETPGKANPNPYEENHDMGDFGDEISFSMSCSGFIFSIIDTSPTELAVVSLHDVKVGASWNSLGNEYARGRVKVGWYQLDNHLPNSAYPVAIRPAMKSEASWTDTECDNVAHAKNPFTADRPFLELKIDVAPRHRTGIQSLSAGASLHDVEVFLDLAFILRMQRWWLGIQDHLMVATGNTAWGFTDSRETWELPNIDNRKTESTYQNQSMYFHNLTILPCKITLSVAPVRALTKHQEEFEGEEASAIHAAVRKGDLLVGEGSGVLGVKIGSKNQTAISVVQGMLKSILVDALLRCDGASLNFEGVALFHHTSNSPQLVTYLGAHYLASLIGNVPALIGSLAAFGNPLGLIRDLGDGVSDFVNEPVKGFKRSLQELDPTFALSGVARGTGSLARRTVSGFADSAAMLTETAAKNMAVLTLDRRYAQRRDRVMKLKAHDAKAATILKGLESGMKKLANGVLEGVTGVVSKPIRGAERSGFEGFAKGVGKGLLGLIMKPVIGTTDLLTDTLIGVKGSVESASDPHGLLTLHSQVRPRRALYGRDRVVKPYRIDDATAATIQSKLCIGGEEYLSHVDMVKKVALMSVKRLLVLSGDGEELLLLPFTDIKRVDVHPQNGAKVFVVRILLHKVKAKGLDFEEVRCDEENMANILCEKLREAINYAHRGAGKTTSCA